jgi:hypothetical protein
MRNSVSRLGLRIALFPSAGHIGLLIGGHEHPKQAKAAGAEGVDNRLYCHNEKTPKKDDA